MNLTAPDWSTVLDEFVGFCSQYNPQFLQTIVAALPDEIGRVEALAGVAFPPEYRAFLQRMGNTSPSALGEFLQHHTYGIEAIERFYGIPRIHAPRDAAYLWTYDVEVPYDIFIRTGGEESDPRPLVQCGWDVDPDTGEMLEVEPDQIPLRSSLPESLYKEAFLHIRDPLLPHFAQLREPSSAEVSSERHRQRRTDFQAIAGRLGFRPVPFMNGDLLFYDRPDASLKLYAQLGADVIYVRADVAREAFRICEILSDSLGMVVWG
jgi:hypothetical protein